MSRWPASYSETPRFDRRAPGPRPLLPLGHCGVRDSQAPPALRRSTTGRGNQDRVRLPPQAARTAGPPRTQPRRYGRVMDDADGALRGLLARPGPDLLRALRDHWRLGQLADGGRPGQVESYVDHDAVMDSWQRLQVGMALLAHTHNLLRHVQVGEQGRRPRFANHLDPAHVAACVRRGTERIGGWRPTAAERRPAAPPGRQLRRRPGDAAVGRRARRAAGRDGPPAPLVDWWVGSAVGR
jgi:hypothetical protein